MKREVNHKDGCKTNNNASNLEWCTRSENLKHAYSIGLEKKKCGEDNHTHKLTAEEAKYIKENAKPRDRVFGFVTSINCSLLEDMRFIYSAEKMVLGKRKYRVTD